MAKKTVSHSLLTELIWCNGFYFAHRLPSAIQSNKEEVFMSKSCGGRTCFDTSIVAFIVLIWSGWETAADWLCHICHQCRKLNQSVGNVLLAAPNGNLGGAHRPHLTCGLQVADIRSGLVLCDICVCVTCICVILSEQCSILCTLVFFTAAMTVCCRNFSVNSVPSSRCTIASMRMAG